MSEVEKNNPHEYEWELENKNIERGAQKAREQREKQIKRSGMSSTTAGNKLVDESVAGVVAEIERRMKIEEDKTGKLEKQAFYDHIHGLDYAVIAKSALIVCLDAAARAQTWNAAMIPAGRALQMAKFTAAMSVNRRGRRLLADVENRAKNRCKKFADRQKYMMDFAKKQGFEGFELWTEDDYRYCGSFMIDIVHVGSNLIEKSPVPQKGAPDGVQHLQFTAFAVEEMRRTNVRLEELSSWFGPMTAPPTPWPSVNGPYLDPRLWNGMVPMVKKMWSPEQTAAINKGIDTGSMDPCIEALNTLQEVPLELNPYIVSALEWVVDEDKGKLIEGFPHLTYDEPPKKMDTKEWKKLAPAEQAEWYEQRKDAWEDKLEADGNLAGLDNNTVDAGDLKTMRFWLPHQFDTRGRIYHTSNFGHHNTDYVRAMFVFSNKTQVTEDNQSYLLLQICNSWGNGEDKKSFKSRRDWVIANWDWILACGEDFVASFDDWRKADDPFQFLAAARELYNYINAEGDYWSGLAIGLDATQSGVQHYAAASLSEEDGVKVNLTASDWEQDPNDLYEAVVELANDMITEDIAFLTDGLANQPDDLVAAWDAHRGRSDRQENDQERELHRWERNLVAAEEVKAWGGVTRKMAKSPTMTWCYSSRRFGFMRTLRKKYFKDLKRKMRDKLLTHPVTSKKVTVFPFEDGGFAASIYLADVFEAAIERIVTSAAQGMDFFQQCARALEAEGKHFAFTTPLGFPMHQYYRQEAQQPVRQRVIGSDRNGTPKKGTKASVAQFTDEIKMPKSENAVAPNVIHAMDATHLMMTVLHCRNHGVEDLLVVHDSFSTSIGHVAELGRCVREAFIDLYDGYCLYEDVLNQTIARLDDPASAHLPTVPTKGTLDLDGVMGNPYAFS